MKRPDAGPGGTGADVRSGAQTAAGGWCPPRPQRHAEKVERGRQREDGHRREAGVDPRAAPGRGPAAARSAFTQREGRVRALSEGFQMHLTKPVAPAELVTVIASVARGMRM